MSTTIRSEVLRSRNDIRIKRIRALQTRGERDRTGLFFADGLRFVIQALDHKARVESLLFTPDVLAHPLGGRLVRRQQRRGIRCLETLPEVYHSISLAEEPQGIGAVVSQRWETLPHPQPEDGLCWVAVESVQSAGNLGTILRTCDAVGSAGLILIGGSVDPYDPATVRASMGAIFSQRLIRTSLPEFAAWKRRRRCRVVGTSPGASTDYLDICYSAPTVLLMGGERKGLSADAQALCDTVVRIPMVGKNDSLNLAVATSVMLYELFNQRRRHTAGAAT